MAKVIVPKNKIADNDICLPEASSLWILWWNAIMLLRQAFSYTSTFLWFTVTVAGLSIHPECVRQADKNLSVRVRLD
jgi:hypothetical protein